ncbi:MAG: helix-turn-helix transcriptional regulator [Clostridiales bacterium]|uniref:helix-turn-helix transcriptional regulator n=1 Tax=Anaerocaecibacter muris TaxID=2941513 RepID=UPI0023C43ED9|nr:helix-turn-helix transcriptional regulator [Clostridiales bacterium]
MNDIISRIDELRVKRGMSKAVFAKEIGVTPTTICNWSRLDSLPALSVIQKVCDVTGVTVEQFFDGLGGTADKSPDSLFIDEWRTLSQSERKAVESVIDAFIENR